MTENEAIDTLQYLLGHENAVNKGELDAPNALNSQEKEALEYILEKIQQYRALGTVEELREVTEKQRAKKPIRNDMCTCPSCGTYNETVKKRRNTVNQDIVYCWHCGQAMEIKRSEEE